MKEREKEGRKKKRKREGRKEGGRNKQSTEHICGLL